MSPSQFSTEIEMLLRQYGWTPDRDIDITSIKALIEEKGFEVFPSVEQFMRQYGGLSFPYETGGKYTRWLDFDVMSSEGLIPNKSHKWMSQWIMYAETDLCPIGRDSTWHEYLFMDRQGRIISADIVADCYVQFYGEPEEAIERILSRKRPFGLRYKNQKKTLAPFNEDRVLDLLRDAEVIASIADGSEDRRGFNENDSERVESFLSAIGYRVHRVAPHFDLSLGSWYEVADILEPVDIVVTHHYEHFDAALEGTSKAKVKVLFPSYNYFSDQRREQAEAVGVRLIGGIGIEDAIRLMRESDG